jgi:hypothetical protein
MQIYEALKQDHDEVKDLLNQLLAVPKDGDPSDLVSQIRDALVPHSRAEEAVFYNSLREYDRAKDKAMHGFKEHMEAETLLRTLQVKDTMPLDWKSTAEKLKQALEHHIREEEGEMFTLAKQFFTEEESTSMTQAFETLKEKTKEHGFMTTTLEMVANLMPPRFLQNFRSYDVDRKSA